MAQFILGDCVDIMESLPAGSVDLVVTSPPYNAGKEYEAELDLQGYTSFAEAWLSQVPRLLTPNGALWLNLGYMKLSQTETMPLTYLYYPIAIKHGLRMIQEVVWSFGGGMSYTKRFSHRSERWMWLVKDPAKYTFNLNDVREPCLTSDPRNNPLGKNPSDVWCYNRVVGGNAPCSEKTRHPCQTPVAMLDRIITACSNVGDTILDPFGGSGSTAVAATRRQRRAISIEIDPTYHQIGQDRLAAELPLAA